MTMNEVCLNVGQEIPVRFLPCSESKMMTDDVVGSRQARTS